MAFLESCGWQGIILEHMHCPIDFPAAWPQWLHCRRSEALGEILIENPWGTPAYRDELDGRLRSVDREGREVARTFSHPRQEVPGDTLAA